MIIQLQIIIFTILKKRRTITKITLINYFPNNHCNYMNQLFICFPRKAAQLSFRDN